jgi:hypothetical protein
MRGWSPLDGHPSHTREDAGYHAAQPHAQGGRHSVMFEATYQQAQTGPEGKQRQTPK